MDLSLQQNGSGYKTSASWFQKHFIGCMNIKEVIITSYAPYNRMKIMVLKNNIAEK